MLNVNKLKIRSKFAIPLAFLSILVIIVSIVSITFNSRLSYDAQALSTTFINAIDKTLNADRDLYQSLVALQNLMLNQANGKSASKSESLKADYRDNAAQARDRMFEVRRLVAEHPELAQSIRGFEEDFKRWQQTADEVVNLLESGNAQMASNLLNGDQKNQFNTVRNYYDTVGEKIKNTADQITADARASGEQQRITLIFTIFLVLIAAGVSIVYGPRLITVRLNKLISVMHNISEGEGDLRGRLDEDGDDEITTLARTFNRLMENLQSLILDIKQQAGELEQNVVSLTSHSQQAESNSSDQDSNLDHIAAAVNELNHAVHEVANNSQSAMGNTQAAADSSNSATDVVSHSSKSINQLNQSIHHAHQVILNLASDSKSIVAVLDVIRDIADQTNLLALNAAIEAARAGEQGRGFAVVADEVRTLASRTQKSTEDINTMLSGLENRVAEAVSAIERGNEEASIVVTASEQIVNALAKVKENIEEANGMIYQIATATEEQSSVVDEINANTSSLKNLSQNNLKSVRDAGNISKQVGEVAQGLSQNVGRFKV